jgi:hypothetical protein
MKSFLLAIHILLNLYIFYSCLELLSLHAQTLMDYHPYVGYHIYSDTTQTYQGCSAHEATAGGEGYCKLKHPGKGKATVSVTAAGVLKARKAPPYYPPPIFCVNAVKL